MTRWLKEREKKRSRKNAEFVEKIKINQTTTIIENVLNDIYLTPPLEQDMTQGQFLSGV